MYMEIHQALLTIRFANARGLENKDVQKFELGIEPKDQKLIEFNSVESTKCTTKQVLYLCSCLPVVIVRPKQK